jgi:hypothetical protein
MILTALKIATLSALSLAAAHVQSPRPAPVPVQAPSGHAGRYVYYNASEAVRILDENGEIHLIPVYLHRYDRITREVWAQTFNGRWIQIK